MQMTIYYREEDSYLLDKLGEKAERERRSKSATILAILEEYFEAEKRIGKILLDFGVLSSKQLQEALSVQREKENEMKLGEILLRKGYVKREEIDRALEIQGSPNSGGLVKNDIGGKNV